MEEAGIAGGGGGGGGDGFGGAAGGGGGRGFWEHWDLVTTAGAVLDSSGVT